VQPQEKRGQRFGIDDNQFGIDDNKHQFGIDDNSTTSSLDLRRVDKEGDFGIDDWSQTNSGENKKLDITMEENEVLDYLTAREKDRVLVTPEEAVDIAMTKFGQGRLELSQ